MRVYFSHRMGIGDPDMRVDDALFITSGSTMLPKVHIAGL